MLISTVTYNEIYKVVILNFTFRGQYKIYLFIYLLQLPIILSFSLIMSTEFHRYGGT